MSLEEQRSPAVKWCSIIFGKVIGIRCNARDLLIYIENNLQWNDIYPLSESVAASTLNGFAAINLQLFVFRLKRWSFVTVSDVIYLRTGQCFSVPAAHRRHRRWTTRSRRVSRSLNRKKMEQEKGEGEREQSAFALSDALIRNVFVYT